MHSGSFRLRIGAELHAVRSGQIAWIAPCIEHTIEWLSPDVDFWTLQIEPWLARTAFGACSAVSAESAPYTDWIDEWLALLPDPPVLEIERRFLNVLQQRATLGWELYQAAWAASPGPNAAEWPWIPPWSEAGRSAATACLLEVFELALRATRAESSAQGRRRIARHAFDALLRDTSQSRDGLCLELDVSERHLSRSFPNVFGTGLASQRARLRLGAFVELARRQSATSLLHAGLAAGFGSYSQLHRIFVEYTGVGPRDYLMNGGWGRAASIVRSGV